MSILKPTWELTNDLQVMSNDARRELLRHLLADIDAEWGEVRSPEEMESQLDYLMGEKCKKVEAHED